MLTWAQALKVVDFGVVNAAVKGGMNVFVYRSLSNYFYTQGIGAIQSAGLIRQVLPDLHGGTYLDSYWRSKQESDQNSYISGLSGDDYIDPAHMIQTPLSQPRKYRYIGDFAYTDDVTGKIVHEYKSYYTDEQLSIGEANEFLYESFDKDKYPEWRSMQYVKFVNVEHNEDWSY